jgi:hypothetical protein
VLSSRPAAPLDARAERILGARDAVTSGTILLVEDAAGTAQELTHALEAVARNLVIDVVDRPSREWLELRRFHYDIVAGGGADLAPMLQETQPQARMLTLEALREPMEALISAGIATGNRNSR